MKEAIESDWKLFRSQLEPWRERYLTKVNKKLAAILADEELNDTDRFWKLKETCDQKARILSDCFDDIRRSTMKLRLAFMLKNKVISGEDLLAFQDEGIRQIENW